MDSIKQIIAKVYALRERGEDGEALEAARMLERLLTKYNLSLEDVLNESAPRVERWHNFPVVHQFEYTLLIQVVAKVQDKTSVRAFRKGRAGIVACTDAEQMQIADMYAHYRREMNEELETFVSAFLQRHSIFPATPKSAPKEMTDEERRAQHIKYEKLRRMMNTLQSSTYIDKSKQLDEPQRYIDL